ncbi:very-short-patch-repair endonuclease [Trueperella bonasi]|uniref:Very-short-patch-repair endonuclease n=1 Tax=Trueperella bonasi TaxID=312286 RepID=A0ABT9NF58_9ACTO|nr:hypothetical protein [Trueperella bonasi]MDP9806030.1 very-short-patch-repair endonuclease [Trueperella bonasi]
MPRVFRRPDLTAQGLTWRQIKQLVDNGRILHLSQGWYAEPGADLTRVFAAQNHIRVGCLSAAQFHNLWVPKPRIGPNGEPHPLGKMTSYIPTNFGPASEVHLLASKHENVREIRKRISKTSRGLTAACVHQYPGDKRLLIATVEEAVEQVARWHDWETALVVIESALNLGKLSPQWIEAMIDRLPRTIGAQLQDFQVGSESGTETRVAHHFRRRGLRVRQQVGLTPDYRADLVVGDSLVVESESYAYHGSRQAFLKDKRRMAVFEELGYNVVSLSYEQVWDYWEQTKQMLNFLIIDRKHLRKVRSWSG